MAENDQKKELKDKEESKANSELEQEVKEKEFQVTFDLSG